MNNFEKIKVMNIDEMAKFLCDLFDNCSSCRYMLECAIESETEKPINPYKQWLEIEEE